MYTQFPKKILLMVTKIDMYDTLIMAHKDSLSASASLRSVIIRGNINFALDVHKKLSIYLCRLG